MSSLTCTCNMAATRRRTHLVSCALTKRHLISQRVVHRQATKHQYDRYTCYLYCSCSHGEFFECDAEMDGWEQRVATAILEHKVEALLALAGVVFELEILPDVTRQE